MAKKGKHLPAAQRLKISEGVKRAQAARLAKSSKQADPFNEPVRFTYQPGSHIASDSGGGSTPRSSKDEYASTSERLATDIVALIVHDNVEPTTLVRVVERILRP